MSKMIQVRNVPDQLHRKLKVRVADRITPQELAERARTIVRDNFEPSPAEILHAERAERGGRP
jgi:plasmid stability protein